MAWIGGVSQEHLTRSEQTLIRGYRASPQRQNGLYRRPISRTEQGNRGRASFSGGAIKPPISDAQTRDKHQQTADAASHDQLVSHFQPKAGFAGAWTCLDQHWVFQDLSQGRGQSFLLPPSQWLTSRCEFIHSKELLDDCLWLGALSEVAASAE